MSTKYINYNTDTIANLNVAQDLGLNDYFLVQPQNFNTKAKILPLKNLVITLDNCTFQSQFNQHTTDINILSSQLQSINGNNINAGSIDTSSYADKSITGNKIDDNTIDYSKLSNNVTETIANMIDKRIVDVTAPSGSTSVDIYLKPNMNNITDSAFSNIAMLDYNNSISFTSNKFIYALLQNANTKEYLFTKSTPSERTISSIYNFIQTVQGNNTNYDIFITTYVKQLYPNIDNDDVNRKLSAIPGWLYVFTTSHASATFCRIQNTELCICNENKWNTTAYNHDASGVSSGKLLLPVTLNMIKDTKLIYKYPIDGYDSFEIKFIPYKKF